MPATDSNTFTAPFDPALSGLTYTRRQSEGDETPTSDVITQNTGKPPGHVGHYGPPSYDATTSRTTTSDAALPSNSVSQRSRFELSKLADSGLEVVSGADSTAPPRSDHYPYGANVESSVHVLFGPDPNGPDPSKTPIPSWYRKGPASPEPTGDDAAAQSQSNTGVFSSATARSGEASTLQKAIDSIAALRQSGSTSATAGAFPPISPEPELIPHSRLATAAPAAHRQRRS